VHEGVLCGLDQFGAGADFPGRILQGGECEAWVAKFSEAFHIFLSWPKVAVGMKRNSCSVNRNGTVLVLTGLRFIFCE
jgi:hypothetical protein